MPFIHIRSLPFEDPVDIPAVIERVSIDFASDTGIRLDYVTTTWEYFDKGHYAVAGKAATTQRPDSPPVLVDLLVPEVNSDQTVEKMLSAVAGSISEQAGVRRNNIFINVRRAQSGMVFDAGEVVRW